MLCPFGSQSHYILVIAQLQPGEELPPGLLTVVETVPGLAVATDQTGALMRGYWPSFNVPFHPQICESPWWLVCRA